jgi:hypothetical protein
MDVVMLHVMMAGVIALWIAVFEVLVVVAVVEMT